MLSVDKLARSNPHPGVELEGYHGEDGEDQEDDQTLNIGHIREEEGDGSKPGDRGIS